uniref:Major facilitator superfamily (MFS) profile domain-containing protein n=1 Tax=Pseudo-nitzschia australis TaxID=44445 RepID=A0A7S4AHB0_9STRA
MAQSCHRTRINSKKSTASVSGVPTLKTVGVLILCTTYLLFLADAGSPQQQQQQHHRNYGCVRNHYRAPGQQNPNDGHIFNPILAVDRTKGSLMSWRTPTKTNAIATTMPRGGSISTKKLKNKKQVQGQKIVAADMDDDPPNLLILIRIMFFTYYASLGSLLPYLPVYYHSLGHGGQVIGMLGAIKPFTTFLVAPLWGIISDQTGSPFTVLYFAFLVSLVGQLAVSWRHDPFWIMSMVFITAVFNAPVKSLIDSMVMSNIKNGKLYGRLRLWGQLGFGVGSSVVGLILSKSQQAQQLREAMGDTTLTTAAIMGGTGTMMEKLDQIWQKITGYKLLFFTHALLSIPTFVCIRAFHRWTKKVTPTAAENSTKGTSSKKIRGSKTNESKPNVLEGIRVLFHNSDALLFFFLVLVVGISSGVIENFAYVRIREVGGSGKEMGLSRLVSSMAGAPMFWFSGPLTELLGADRVLALSLVNYVFRYFNYAFMQNPLQGLPAEALRGATFAAFWSTCTIYASRIAPPGMQATMVR